MKQGLTELVFILDQSGSMCGLEADTIGGYNAMLHQQKELPGECQITTVLFNTDHQLLHDRVSIQEVSPITEQEYQVGGSTALLDAIGSTIHKIINDQKHNDNASKADKAIFVIITDGQENSSCEYSLATVKELIEHQQQNHNWEFIFFGANIDAIETAKGFGICEERAQNFHADSAGVELNFQVMSEAVAAFRESTEVPDDWSAEIEQDFRERQASN